MLDSPIITNFFSKIEGVISVHLFGSYAMQTDNSKSDVDIAVLWKHSMVPSIMEQIEQREELASLLGKDVDLLCLNLASPIVAMQVYKANNDLLVVDHRLYINYLMRLFLDYAELKELRAPMEKNILRREVL